MKRVTDALAVSRSNTYERSRSPRPRPERYSKAEDAFLLPLIVELLGGRQTYGYRRIQRLLNRQLIAGGRTPVNHKRVYRIMRQNNLFGTVYWQPIRQSPHGQGFHTTKKSALVL